MAEYMQGTCPPQPLSYGFCNLNYSFSQYICTSTCIWRYMEVYIYLHIQVYRWINIYAYIYPLYTHT